MSPSRRAFVVSTAVLLVAVISGIALPRWPTLRKVPTQRELLNHAVQAASSATRDERLYIYREIARAQARRAYYEDAIATARLVDEYQDQLLIELIEIRASNGDIAGVKTMITNQLPRQIADQATLKVALAQARKGDRKDALETANGQFSDQLLAELGAARLESGDIDAALRTANEMSRGWSDDLLYGIAAELAKRGDLQRAKEVARQIVDPQMAAAAIPSPFEQALLACDLRRALELARKLPLKERPNALLSVAKQQIEAGKRDEAAEILGEATNLARNIQHKSDRAEVLGQVAVMQIDARMPSGALLLLQGYPENRETKDGHFEFARTPFCDVSWALARAQRFKEAYALAERGSCGDDGVAFGQYEAGDPDGAIEAIRWNPNPSDVSAHMAELAETAAKKNDLRNALRFANLVNVPGAYEGGEGYLAPALREIAHAWAKSGKEREAYEWARSRPSAYQRAMALLGLAEGVPSTTSP